MRKQLRGHVLDAGCGTIVEVVNVVNLTIFIPVAIGIPARLVTAKPKVVYDATASFLDVANVIAIVAGGGTGWIVRWLVGNVHGTGCGAVGNDAGGAGAACDGGDGHGPIEFAHLLISDFAVTTLVVAALHYLDFMHLLRGIGGRGCSGSRKEEKGECKLGEIHGVIILLLASSWNSIVVGYRYYESPRSKCGSQYY